MSWFAGAFVALCGFVAVFNAIVDPQARLLIVDRPGFNEAKVTLAHNSRKGKSTALRQCSYDTLVVGTSRAETAIDFEHRTFANTSPYNAAFRGGTIYEMRRVVDYALQNQNLTTVYLSLDFEAFNARIVSTEDFDVSPLAEETSPGSVMSYLFSLRTLGQSYTTMQRNVRGRVTLCRYTGEHIRTYERIPARQAFDFILRRYLSGHYNDYVADDLHMRHFEALLQQLVDAGVTVYAFTSPMHVVNRELLREKELAPYYDEWRRQLVRVFERVNRGMPAERQAVLWDFSGYNTITTETVPPPGSETLMTWYDDSSHFNKAVGNLMLERMTAAGTANSSDSAEFGVRLTPDSIDAVIAADQRGSDRYRERHPEEIARLQRLVEAAPELP